MRCSSMKTTDRKFNNNIKRNPPTYVYNFMIYSQLTDIKQNVFVT